MNLPETPRQIIAGSGAGVAFLAAYFGLSFTVWAALAVGVLVFAALLLLIRRTPPAAELMIAEGVSAADLDTALTALRVSAQRLRGLEGAAPAPDASVFVEMAVLLDRIGAHHSEDPRDLRHTRSFLRRDLPRLVEVSETYVELSNRANAASETRLAQLSKRIHGFKPVLEKIETACLENDFMQLEVETEVLSDQLKYR